MPIKRDVKDEEKGAKHYEHLAKKFPKQRIALESMAKDEEKHEGMLKEMK